MSKHTPGDAGLRLRDTAPELLAALKKLIAQYDDAMYGEYAGSSVLDKFLSQADHARAAIAKAEDA